MNRAALAALFLAVACKPAVRGQCSKSGDCREGSFCSTEGICLPGAGLSLAVFEPPASDAVNGWVPRAGTDLDVRVTVETQDGSPPQEATLVLDTCPAEAPCSYAGTLVSQGSTSAAFSFQVPRVAQAQGSEAPVAFTVTARDHAGNQAQAKGALQIDDAPPVIGMFTAVSHGVAGEDGKTWFVGGSGAPPVEIAVPVADSGAGVGALDLQLDSADVLAGTTLSLPGTPGGDGTVHFQLPASAVRGKEEHLRFTLSAVDRLQHATSLGPDNAATQIWVDALAPVISAPRVDYAGASGPGPQCAADSATYECGRQAGTHLLPDDRATVSFDAYDCGAGLLAAQPDASATTAAGARPFSVSETGQGATQCGNGSTNPVHHYSFTLDLGTVTLDAPAAVDGTAKVQLAATALDRVQQNAAASGTAQASVWRWKSQIAPSAQPSGSAALLPGTSGSRQIAVGTTLTPSSPNLFVVDAAGTTAWSAIVLSEIGADLAVGPSGAVYAISPRAASCTTRCDATLNIVHAPSSGSVGTVQQCPAPDVSFGAPPMLLWSPEIAIAASTAHDAAALANVFFFSGDPAGCVVNQTTVGTGDYAGVSASPPTVFFANGQGFLSQDLNTTATAFTGPVVPFNAGTTTTPAVAPPSVATDSVVNAIFGTASPDKTIRRTLRTTCAVAPCWQTDSTFKPQAASSGLPYTPVFDLARIYAADDSGVLYAYARATGGSPAWTAKFRDALPPPWPTAASATISAPVLLTDGSLLEVRSDGLVSLVSPAGAIVPLLMANPVATPMSPVIDLRGTGGVAYVSDGAGWLWAVQLATAPAIPGASVWPRPGRDSCNSRNAASSCP